MEEWYQTQTTLKVSWNTPQPIDDESLILDQNDYFHWFHEPKIYCDSCL